MTEQQSINNQTSGSFYHNLGANSALNTNASITALEASLDAGYSDFQKREKNLNSERISQYQAELTQFITEKGEKQAELRQLEVQKKFKADQIKDKDAELVRFRAEGGNPEYLPFGIGTIILVLLTGFLFIYYSSTGYSTFFGLPTKLIGGFLSPSVYNDAVKYGGGAIAFVVLFPVIFIAMGFVIHIVSEKIQNASEKGQSQAKQYLILIGILLATLLFDIIMAYNIAEKLYIKKFNQGVVVAPWKPAMAFKDINFYIIIASGFVVYLIWGYIINFVFSEWKRIQPNQILQAGITTLQNEILSLTAELASYESQISLLNSRIQQIEYEISDRQKKINILNGGGIVIDLAALRGMVGEFMNGWNSYIKFRYPNTVEAEGLMAEANNKAAQWVEEKIRTLN
jgi:hypothetical protein